MHCNLSLQIAPYGHLWLKMYQTGFSDILSVLQMHSLHICASCLSGSALLDGALKTKHKKYVGRHTRLRQN